MSERHRKIALEADAFDTQKLIAANDLIYRNPPAEGWQGWLFGDGAAGVTLWNPADRLALQFGHTDLLDEGGGPTAAGTEGPCLRHAAQAFLEVVAAPLFDPLYLKSYAARLSLADARLTASGASEFGTFSFQAFFSEQPGVFVLEYADELVEPAARRFRLQRYGSRTLHPGVVGSTRDGLDGTAVSQPRPDVFLVEHNDANFHCATAVRLEMNGLERTLRSDAHGLTIEFAPSAKFEARILFAIGLPTKTQSAKDAALAALEAAAAFPPEQLLKQHTLQKRAQWDELFIHLPQDPYFAQLWYLARYHLKASWRGTYPPFFINGPWGWNHDVRMWPMCWYHWNFHGAALSLADLGETEAMVRAYAAWRMRQLPTARGNAEKFFKCRGAMFQDQQWPQGKTDCWTADRFNLFMVTGPQTCLHLYELWRITGDERFLTEQLYPYMRETVLFFRDYLQADENGVLHVPRSIPYEFHGGYAFRDCLTDVAHLRALLPAFARVAERALRQDELSAWAEQAAGRLAPFVPVGFPLEYVTAQTADGRRIYNNPFFFGDKALASDRVLAIGIAEREKRWVSHVETHANVLQTGGYGVLCSAQTAHVFPAGLITSDDSPQWADIIGAGAEQRELWAMSVNALRTIRRYPREETASDKADVAEDTIAWTGHSLELPAFARLGLTEPLRKAMNYYITHYQLFPQGMWNYHPRKRWWLGYAAFKFHDKEQGRCDYYPWHLHFAFEPQGIFSKTVCLMLLDSVGDLLRLFPAYDRDGAFRLPARGGFIVTAQQLGGRLVAVDILSRTGETCKVRLPWKSAWVRDETTGVEKELPVAKGILVFSTERGKHYRIREPGTDGFFQPVTPPEAAPRENGVATLGLFRRM